MSGRIAVPNQKMNYDKRSAERRKNNPPIQPAREYLRLVRWVWALIAVAFVLSLMR